MRQVAVLLVGACGAACLEATPGAEKPPIDGAPDVVDAAVQPEIDGAPGSDAGPCPVDYRDEFNREEVGDGWVFYGDSSYSVEEVEDGALSIEVTATSLYSFGALHSDMAWPLGAHTIEAHVTPSPSGDGDTFFGWIEEDGNRYVGITSTNPGSYFANIQGTLGMSPWTEHCAPSCPDFEPGPQRWRVGPDEDGNLRFEVAVAGSNWQVLQPPVPPPFERGYLTFWAETDVGMTSTMTARAVTASSCD